MNWKIENWKLILNKEQAEDFFEELKSKNVLRDCAKPPTRDDSYPFVAIGSYDCPGWGPDFRLNYISIEEFEKRISKVEEELRGMKSIQTQYERWDS